MCVMAKLDHLQWVKSIVKGRRDRKRAVKIVCLMFVIKTSCLLRTSIVLTWPLLTHQVPPPPPPSLGPHTWPTMHCSCVWLDFDFLFGNHKISWPLLLLLLLLGRPSNMGQVVKLNMCQLAQYFAKSDCTLVLWTRIWHCRCILKDRDYIPGLGYKLGGGGGGVKGCNPFLFVSQSDRHIVHLV